MNHNKSHPFIFIIYLLLGLFLLLLFHYESIYIGPVKISHLWKGALLFYLLFNLLNKKKKQAFIFKPLLWLAFFQIINKELFNNTFNAFLLFSTNLILPLIGIYVLNFSAQQLRHGLLFFASFFILSFVPYELGLLKSIQDGYQLASYGTESTGVIGPFQTVHSASVALAASFLVVLYFWFARVFQRLYLTSLLVLGFYFLILTYVRTGMLMVVIGAIPIIVFFAKKEASTRIRLVVIGILFSFLISGLVLSNEILMDRITGKREHSTETDSFEDLGSGRGQIYIYAVEIFSEAHFLEQLLGVGQTEQLYRMQLKLGKGLIPHNGFLLVLLNNGIIGLLVFVLFLKKVFDFTTRLSSKEKSLVRGLFYAYLVMSFFQNYDMLYMYLMLVLSMAYVIQQNKKVKLKRSILNSTSKLSK